MGLGSLFSNQGAIKVTEEIEVQEVEEPKTKKYRVLRGTYCENGTRYKKGSVVETEKDLLKFNHGPFSQKFALVNASVEEQIAKPNATEYTDYTVEELKLIADDEEIDIKGLTKKADIIAAIEKSMMGS